MPRYTPNISLPAPEGSDSVLTSDDVWKLALSVDKSLRQLNDERWLKGELRADSNLETIGFGAWGIPSGSVSLGLGLPTGLSGVIVKMPTDGSNAVISWYPRSNPASIFQANLTSSGISRWFEVGHERITPKTFGALGDGVADDSAALEKFFTYAASNGGEYYFGMANYRVTRQIWIPETNLGFVASGVNSILSRITMDSAQQTTVLAGRGLKYTVIRRLGVSGLPGKLASHGFSFSDCVSTTAEEIRVSYYQNSAGLFFRFTESAVSEGNKIIRCEAFGGNVANNGFLHETSRNWLIQDCNVSSLAMDGSPGYALQAKNSCSNGHIRGGIVVNAPAAVAFGSDTASSTNTRCHVSGVVAVGCRYGLISSRTTYSNVEILVDAAGMPGGGYPVYLGAGCTGLNVKAAVHRVPTGRTVAYVGSSGNTVELEPLSQKPEYLAEFVIELKNTTLVYKGDPEHALINDFAANATNRVVTW